MKRLRAGEAWKQGKGDLPKKRRALEMGQFQKGFWMCGVSPKVHGKKRTVTAKVKLSFLSFHHPISPFFPRLVYSAPLNRPTSSLHFP